MATAPPSAQRVAARIEREERRRKAVELAIAAVPYAEIAERLGYGSAQAAHKDVKTVLLRVETETDAAGRELRAVQIARLEQLYRDARKIFSEFADADEYSDKADQRLAAMDRMLRIGESLRKLVGADAPARTESKIVADTTVSYQVAVAPEELEQL